MARCETSWRVVFVFFRFARETMRRTNTHGAPLRTRSSHRKDDGWSQISSRRSIWLAATRQNGPLGLHSRWAVRETWGFPIADASEAPQTQVSGVRIDRPDVFCDHPCEYARQVAPKSTDRAGGVAGARPLQSVSFLCGCTGGIELLMCLRGGHYVQRQLPGSYRPYD